MYIIGTKKLNQRGQTVLAFGTPPFEWQTLEDATQESQRLLRAGNIPQGAEQFIFRAVRKVALPAGPAIVEDLPVPDNAVLERRAAIQQEAIEEDAAVDDWLADDDDVPEEQNF